VNLVFEALRKAGIRINKPKCIFHAKEVEFLSYIIGLDGIKINPKKVQAIQDWLISRNMTEV
jgi:hypothetical protein